MNYYVCFSFEKNGKKDHSSSHFNILTLWEMSDLCDVIYYAIKCGYSTYAVVESLTSSSDSKALMYSILISTIPWEFVICK